MASANVTVSFEADASPLTDAIAAVQPALAGLSAPVAAFQEQVSQAFGDTSALDAWSNQVTTVAQSAGNALSQVALTLQTGFTARLDPIGNGVARLFTDMTARGETFGQAFLQVGDQMLARFVGWVAEMVERWAVSELTQTAASQAGSAARAAVQDTAAATGMAASGAQALADIGNSAARAAAGAYAAVASTPVVGPVLAPAAAATALAAALEFGGQVVSAAGGWGQVPYDGALASLHKDEMVLPASLASPLRSALGTPASGGGGGGGASAVHHHWNISALDAGSFARMSRSNPDAITGALTAAAQRLSLTPDRLSSALSGGGLGGGGLAR